MLLLCKIIFKIYWRKRGGSEGRMIETERKKREENTETKGEQQTERKEKERKWRKEKKIKEG